MQQRRRFNGRERVALYLASGGKCAACGVELAPGWHADHRQAYVHGGATDVVNGQALCPTCNLRKGSKGDAMASQWQENWEPRKWQRQAWAQFRADKKRDWLLCATPGAGKTQWALGLARQLLDNETVKRVVVIAPTQTIRDQWMNQTSVHLAVIGNEHGGLENFEDFEGVALTYAQVARQPDLQRMGCMRPTLVIFDEIHHAGYPNITWGEQVRRAFESAIVRLGLTGTPWRRTGRIPFVSYREDGEVMVDFAYEYGEAVRDGVCRAVEFRAYDGEVKYVYLDSCNHSTVSYTLEDEDDTSDVLRSLLDVKHPWLHSMLQNAHHELLTIRHGDDGEGAVPDAKGLIVADTQEHARAIARLVEQMTGEKPALIISDEADSETDLEHFRTDARLWAVAVNKVSEGVDVPALYVGVYATRKKTPLIFRQITGRFVRRRSAQEIRPAVLFIPATPALKELASKIEEELRYSVDIERELYEQDRSRPDTGGEDDEWQPEDLDRIPTDTSIAELDMVILGGVAYPRAEYDAALVARERFGFGSDDVIRIINMLRTMGATVTQERPAAADATRKTEELPKDKYRKTLLRELERLSRKRALAYGIGFDEMNTHLTRKFGAKRHKLPIAKLEAQLKYLNEMRTDYQPDIDGGAQ